MQIKKPKISVETQTRVIVKTPRNEFLRRMRWQTGGIYRGDSTKSSATFILKSLVQAAREENIDFNENYVNVLYWKEAYALPSSAVIRDDVFETDGVTLTVVLPKELRDWWSTPTEFVYYV